MERGLSLEGKSLDQLLEKACEELSCLPEDLEISIEEVSQGGILSGKRIKAYFRIKPARVLSERANRAILFLKELFHNADLNIELKTNLNQTRMEVDLILSGEDLKYLLVNGGEPISALEFLTNKIVAKSLGVGPKVNLKPEGIDLEGERRFLRALQRAISLIKEDKKPRTLRIRTKREERIVERVLREYPEISYTFEGEGKERKVKLEVKPQA
jgi:spoIIIJ-associated protein